MIISGQFNNYKNKRKYEVNISSTADQGDVPNTISDESSTEAYSGNNCICFGPDPITLSCDYSDTFNRIIIKSATIRLVANFNLKDIVLANNQREISVVISCTENNVTTTIFKGNVEPLCFNEPYAHNWESFELTATDILGSCQYLYYHDIISANLDGTGTTEEIINNIATSLGLSSLVNNAFVPNVTYRGIDSDILAAMSTNKINNSIWIGESMDDWYTYEDVLTQIGKYWGLWFMMDGDELVVFDWHNKGGATYTSKQVQKADYTDASTEISNADAYTQIKLECNINDGDELVEFGDDVVPAYDTMTKYLEQYVATGEGSHALNAFYDLIQTRTTTSNKYTESYIIPNYCQVYKTDQWEFTYDYLDPTVTGAGTAHPQQDILYWLRNNGQGAAAFIAFGQGEKQSAKSNAPQNSLDIKPSLIISIMGEDDRSNAALSRLKAQVESHTPLCTYHGVSSTFTPPDTNTTNYIVISGQILLNRLQALSGYPMHCKSDDAAEYEDTNSKLYMDTEEAEIVGQDVYSSNTHKFNMLRQLMGIIKPLSSWSFSTIFGKKVVKKISDNGDGAYYQHRFCADDDSTTATMNPLLYGNLHNDKFNKAWQYSRSQVNGTVKEIDNTSKIPILKCMLKIGDKYCVERLDQADGLGKFQWLVEDDCPYVDNDTDERWKYFTIGIDPDLEDYIIGQEYEIANNIWYYQNVKSKGTAIPINYTDNLQGAVEFSIMGPMDITYTQVNKKVKGILWWKHTTYPTDERPILQQLSSIIVSELKMEVLTDNGKKGTNTGNNDLVYASDTNPDIFEPYEDDVDICTMITSDEAAEWGTEMHVSNSHVTNSDGSPFLGFPVYENDPPEEDEEPLYYIKPEQLFVSDFYQEYHTPRTILSTQLKLENLDWMLNPEAHKFNFNYIDGEFIPVGFEAGLKYNNITFSLKDMQYYDSTNN